MAGVDIFTSYALAGAGALVGLGLMGLVRTDQPRIRQAVHLYRAAFVCLAAMLLLAFGPAAWQPRMASP